MAVGEAAFGSTYSRRALNGTPNPEENRYSKQIDEMRKRAKARLDDQNAAQAHSNKQAAAAVGMVNPVAGMAVGAGLEAQRKVENGIGTAIYRTKDAAVGILKGGKKIGFALGGAATGAASLGARGVSAAHDYAVEHKRVTGTMLPFIVAVVLQVYDARFGFPRIGAPQFGAIIGGYAILTIIWVTLYHQRFADTVKPLLFVLFFPWILQVLLTLEMFSFLRLQQEVVMWSMVLVTPYIWYIFSMTDIEHDTIMKWTRFIYIGALCILLIFPLVTFVNNSFGTGPGTQLPTEEVSRDILKELGQNTRKVMSGVVNFVPDLIRGQERQLNGTPPDGSTIGQPHRIGLMPTDKVITARVGSTQQASIELHVESPDRMTYEFDNQCRLVCSATSKGTDEDRDGFTDWDAPNTWTPINKIPRLATSRIIYCPLNLASAIAGCDSAKNTDSAKVEFQTRYQDNVIGSYTTYFINGEIGPDNVLQTPYVDEQDFFRRNFGLDTVPISKATDSPCLISIDNDKIRPPITILEENEQNIPLRIGFKVNNYYGDSNIDSIDSLEIEPPPGVTSIVCENDPSFVTKVGDKWVMSAEKSKYLHGNTIRMDCLIGVNRNNLIWSGDYAMSTFRVASTCSIVNRNTMSVRLVSGADGGGAGGSGGYSANWGTWPLDGAITDCFGEGTNPFDSSKTRWHDGVDIDAKGGMPPVMSIADGIVSSICTLATDKNSKPCNGYGNVVMVKHADNLYTFYGHLSEVKVGEGQKVKAGDMLGFAGSTGESTGPHLHFGVSLDGDLKYTSGDSSTNPLCGMPKTSPSGENAWSGICKEPVCASDFGGGTVTPAGMPSQARIDRFTGKTYTPTGYSGSLKQLADAMASKYDVPASIIATAMTTESGMADPTNACPNGRSRLTGCGQFAECNDQCGCISADTENDYTQTQCTANWYGSGNDLTGPYSVCQGRNGDAKYICIACVYGGQRDSYSASGTCSYADSLFKPIWAEWKNYYAQSGGTASV